ncbi:MAG: nickel pincer cofactor biosynthesis protein LarC [Pseudomonadota bacterium]
MKIAYFDCFSGASGDMILGSLLDAGLPLTVLKSELAKLGLSHYDVQVAKVVKKGLSGSQALVTIEQDHHHHHRNLEDIEGIIEKSSLDPDIKRDSIRIFTRLAEAEAKVHDTTVDSIHFHEVGAMDAIIDVVGAVIGLKALGIDKVFCSPLHVGTGTLICAHGELPVPAPATAELLKGKPIYATGVQGELVTPTGAAILTTLAEGFGPMPTMTVERIGHGAGTADRSISNLLRLFAGTTALTDASYQMEQSAVIETTIDDMNPQIYDYLIEKILQMGAQDIFFQSVQMKKNRAGILLSILCRPEMVSVFADFLFKETTTIGLRWRIDNRIMAQRKTNVISTRSGDIHCKVSMVNKEIVNITPEYDDCKRIAAVHHIPLKTVMEEARAKAFEISLYENLQQN